ncbi:hypothetical protein V8E54_011146 [Elaphomyces granulatus]
MSCYVIQDHNLVTEDSLKVDPSHDCSLHLTIALFIFQRFAPLHILGVAMLCQQTLFIIAAFLTTAVHSLPSPPPGMGLKVIRQYEAEVDNITRYKDQAPAKRSFDTVDINRPQCTGSGNPNCSSQDWTFAPYQSDCAGLLSVLSGQPTNGTVERDIYSVCYSATGGGQYSRECCISSTKPISNVVDKDYLNFAITLYSQCGNAKTGQVAGFIGYTTINSECNIVCLIDDYNDCTLLILPHWK